MASPTSRTLAKLRKDNHMAGVVERYNTFSKQRHDLFGFIDIVAVIDNRIVAIQATSGSNVNSRVIKIMEERKENAVSFLRADGVIQVWGWRKIKPRGTKRAVFDVRIVEIELKGLRGGLRIAKTLSVYGM